MSVFFGQGIGDREFPHEHRPTTCHSISAEDLFDEGTRLMGLGDVQNSERVFRRAIAEAPALEDEFKKRQIHRFLANNTSD